MFLDWSTVFCLFLLTLYLTIRRLLHRLQIRDATSRHVLITGCDTGFGNLLARSLDGKGMLVIAGCLTAEGASKLQNVSSSRLKTLILDVADDESIASALENVTSILPNNKGDYLLCCLFQIYILHNSRLFIFR